MDIEEGNKKLKEIIEGKKKEIFVKGYKATDEEILGVIISQYFEWIGKSIADTFLNALEDSNFHTLRAEIEELWSKEEL